MFTPQGGLRLIAAVVLLASACDHPPLHVRRSEDGFVIDVQTLGEYKTTVQRIRLLHRDDLVWEARARAGTGHQLHSFLLRAGNNRGRVLSCGGGPVSDCPSPELYDDFAVAFPPGESFTLEPGERYVLEVWGSDSRLSRSIVEFVP